MSTTPSSPFNENPSSRPEAAGRSGEIPVSAPAHAAGARTFQPWIIFRKDLLHTSPELLVSLRLLVAFAWTSTAASAPQDPTASFSLWALLAGIVRFLIPLSWM